MKKLFKLQLLGVGFVLLTLTANAQQSGQLGYFDLLPQSIYANPALQPTNKLNIGIPGLSGLFVQHGNNWYNSKDYLKNEGNSSVSFNAEAILNNIDEYAYTGQSAAIELIHVGFKINKHYFSLKAAERLQFQAQLPRDVFALAVYGNVGPNGFENNTADFSGLGINAIHYREYGIGYSYEINDKFTAGVSLKYLYGMERIETNESSLNLYTDPNTYELQSSGSFSVNTSGIYGNFSDEDESVQSDLMHYTSGLDNNGFGADLGLVYRPIEKLQLEFSANDLGFIKWNSDVANYSTTDATFAYRGIDLTDYIFETGSDFNDSFQEALDSISDELENTYDFEKSDNAFTTSLNGYFRYSASWDLLETEKMTGKIWANMMHGVGGSDTPFSFALGYNHKFWRNIQASVNYSKRSHFKGSMGCGLVLAAGPVQIYALVENIRFANLSKIDIVDSETGESDGSVLYFSDPGDIKVNVGINLAFKGKDDRKSARPMSR
jgi:hypothetical protein